MKYDFVEIGTSNHNALIIDCLDDAVGISVEPVTEHINSLPNKPNVVKMNVAVAFDDKRSTSEVYYVPEKQIMKHNLDWLMIGSNAIGNYHDYHINAGVTDLVVRQPVELVPASYIFETNDVTEVDFFKVDIEGWDWKIILNFCKYLETKPFSFYPKRIQFEANNLTQPEHAKAAVNILREFNYQLKNVPSYMVDHNLRQQYSDIVMELK